MRFVMGTFAESGEITVLNEETGENGGFCVEISDEKARSVHSHAQSNAGRAATRLLDDKNKTSKTVYIKENHKGRHGRCFALWVWVEKRTDVILNWNGSQVQLGEDWDKKCLCMGRLGYADNRRRLE